MLIPTSASCQVGEEMRSKGAAQGAGELVVKKMKKKECATDLSSGCDGVLGS